MGRESARTEKEGKRQWEIKIKPERERTGWMGGARERERNGKLKEKTGRWRTGRGGGWGGGRQRERRVQCGSMGR